MRTLPLTLAVLLAGPLATAAPAQELPPQVRAAAERISGERIMRDVEHLASDALLGRNTPSAGFDSAAVYIARRLERAGLKPLGDDGTYFQHYVVREDRLDTAAASLGIDGRRFRFGDDFIMRALAGPVGGTMPVVFVGHGWTVPELGIDPYAGIDVRNKLLLVIGGDSPPAGSGVRQIGRVSIGGTSPFVEAERRGAAGILFVATQRHVESWERSRRMATTRMELVPPVPSAYAAPPVTAAVLAPHAAEALLADENISAAIYSNDPTVRLRAEPVQLQKRVTLDLPLSGSVMHRPYNVVAMIEGSDSVLRNEYITLESHLDGAVGTAVVDGDGIYNSADDNASGSAGNLAIAEQMMTAPRPKRSLIFIWDSGEERGLWGTRHFVHEPPVPLEHIVAHFNIDMIGATRAPDMPDADSPDVTGPNEVYLIGPGVLSPTADALLERVNRSLLGMRLDRRYDTPDSEFFYPRTDAGPFLERGILTIGFFTGLHDRYHRPADQARFLDPAKMEAVSRTVFATAWMLADSAERPRIERPIPETVPDFRSRAAAATTW